MNKQEINELSGIDVREKLKGLEEVVITNKQALYNYLYEDFSELFFTKGKYVQELMRIVGPIRLRTIHTKTTDCPIKSPFKKCFSKSMLDDDLIEKQDLNGVKYSSCEDLRQNHVIEGE